MLRIEGSGPHLLLLSSLCAECPQGSTGCCAGPPEYDWSDIGRVVSLGGRDFLLEQLAVGHLTPASRGLVLRRVRKRAASTTRRRRACVHHGPQGCTIPQARRPATCNYYLCQDAYAQPSEGLSSEVCKAVHGRLAGAYRAWDDTLAELVRQGWPDGPAWEAGFLDWLGERFAELVREDPGLDGR